MDASEIIGVAQREPRASGPHPGARRFEQGRRCGRDARAPARSRGRSDHAALLRIGASD